MLQIRVLRKLCYEISVSVSVNAIRLQLIRIVEMFKGASSLKDRTPWEQPFLK